MRTVSRTRTTLVVALGLLAGCAESRITAPQDDGFDLATAGQANATMNGLVTGSAMSGVAALGGRMPTELGPSGSAFPVPPSAGPGIPALALRLLGALPAGGGPLTVPVIRPAVLGHTYIYDPVARRYVADLSRAGAPANGVRFILYAVDSGSHEPIVSQETGYADLTDLIAGALGVGLRFRAVSGGRTFLDYAFTLTPTFTGGVLGVSGFLADEQHRLDFTIGAVGRAIGESRSARVTFDLALPSRQYHATGSIEASDKGSAETARVEVDVAIGADVIHLGGESSRAAVNARLSVNGRLFATITGDPLHPTVRGDGGRELSAVEVQVLAGLVGMVYGTIELFEHLLEPVAVLLGISISL